MALFDGVIPPLEVLICCPEVLRFLELLLDDFTCLTATQSHQVLRGGPAPSGQNRKSHELARDILYALEKGKYLQGERVKRLPPRTIGSAPIFRMFREDPEAPKSESRTGIAFGGEPVFSSRLPTTSEICSFTNLAKQRVLPLEAHCNVKLYFATSKARDLIYPDKSVSLQQVSPYKGPPPEIDAMQLIEWHRTIETDNAVTPYVIASTNLTAIFNLNELMLVDGLRSALASRGWKYKARGRNRVNMFDGTLFMENTGAVVHLYFLRPLQPDALLDAMATWWLDAGYVRNGWWL